MIPPANHDTFSVVDIAKYERDVLGLHDAQMEKHLDDKLMDDARRVGVDVAPFSLVVANTPVSPSSARAAKPPNYRRVSGESTFSASTFASTFSRRSQETQITLGLPRRIRSESRPSLSNNEHDKSLYGSTSPSSRSSISLSRFSPPTSRSPSTTHLPQESSSSSSFIRGLGRLSRLRKPEITQDTAGRPPSSPSPSHRRYPVISGLAQVLARKDGETCQDQEVSPSDNRARSPDSIAGGYATGRSTPQGSIASRGASPDEAMLLREDERLKALALLNFRRAMQYPEFQELHQTQRNQRDRFLAFTQNQQPLLAARRENLKARELARHPHAVDDMEVQHAADLTRLEDRHVAAEMDLREAHDLEQRNCLIALRHMVAYCKGDRNVSEQDRRNLERQYWLRDHLGQKHESAINVLREQQAKQIRVRSHKHEAEVAAAQRRHEAELRSYDQIFEMFDAQMAQLKARMVWRWELAIRIWKIGAGLEGADDEGAFPIAPVDWPIRVRTSI